MSKLEILDLGVKVAGKQILEGLSMTIAAGEVHALMGPNGAGKSSLSAAVMGRPTYEVTSGSVLLDGEEMLGKETWERARAGLFLAMQYPTEVPGVELEEVLSATGAGSEEDLLTAMKSHAKDLGHDEALLSRGINADLSGGEKKRTETIQLAVLQPKFAILDELDSGLDIDSLEKVSSKVEAQTESSNLGVLVITHYNRLLSVLKPDVVHVLAGGKIARSGGPELATELEETGYANY